MVNRSPKGVQDSATYVFASRAAKTRMLLVIASSAGLQAQEIAANDRQAEGLANALPLTEKQGELLSSKKIFKLAEAAGLKGAEDVVVMNTRVKDKAVPLAIVTDDAGQSYMVMNAVTGEPMSPVQKLGARTVQMHILIIGGVVLAVAVGAAVWWAVKKWRDHGKPQPQPSDHPNPIPTATPVPTPVPTSKPSGSIQQILAGPFGAQFDRLDIDHDGKLTQTEYVRAAQDDATKRLKTNEYAEFLDANHDQQVTKSEFLAGMERSIAALEQMSFSMLDGDQNGGLDAREVQATVKGDEFGAADTNHDGKLSLSEYMVPFARQQASFAQYYG
jgi:hypothetical protein